MIAVARTAMPDQNAIFSAAMVLGTQLPCTPDTVVERTLVCSLHNGRLRLFNRPLRIGRWALYGWLALDLAPAARLTRRCDPSLIGPMVISWTPWPFGPPRPVTTRFFVGRPQPEESAPGSPHSSGLRSVGAILLDRREVA